MKSTLPSSFRRVRSFVRREGRMTRGQRLALQQLWQCYGLELQNTLLDLDQVFGRTAPRVMEIGFGMGRSLLEMAQKTPEQDYLGIEVHRPGVGTLLLALEQHQLNNVRVFCADALEVLEHAIPDESINTVQLFFPDPWPKRRHQKRRLVQLPFVEMVRRKLKPGGQFHMATDWEEYALHMLAVMKQSAGFVNASASGDFVPRPESRPLTKFELRGQRLGHGVWDLIFLRKDSE